MVEQDLPISLSGEAVPEEIVVHRSKFVEILTNEKITGWDLDVITAIPGRKMVIALSSTESSYGSYEQELYKLARKFQKKLQEETNSSFTLYIVQGRISLYEFKRFYDENKNVFLEKYLEGVGEIRKLDCSQVQELGKEQIVVSSKKNLSMENMLKEPDSQIRIQMLHEILSIACNDDNDSGFYYYSCSRNRNYSRGRNYMRKKYRIRIYNNNDKFIKLERKKKFGSYIYKESAPPS